MPHQEASPRGQDGTEHEECHDIDEVVQGGPRDIVDALLPRLPGNCLVRRLGSLGFVDHNLEDQTVGPILQDICHYRVADDDWEWDADALRFLPNKIRDKFQAAAIDPYRLRLRVADGDAT